MEKGVTYKLYHADLYRVSANSGKWEFVDHIYDPDFYKKHYVERDGAILRRGSNGQMVPVRRSFSDDFENAKAIHDMIGLQRGWTEFVLLSPMAPSVNDYVLLRKRILAGQSDFLDNRVEPTTEVVHRGKGAMKTYSVAPSRNMTCAKAFLGCELLHFVKGDDVWLSGWFYVPEGSEMPFTVMDLKTTWIKEYPGMRIMISGGKYAGYELKWGGKPKYCQPRGKEAPFPVAQWVHREGAPQALRKRRRGH